MMLRWMIACLVGLASGCVTEAKENTWGFGEGTGEVESERRATSAAGNDATVGFTRQTVPDCSAQMNEQVAYSGVSMTSSVGRIEARGGDGSSSFPWESGAVGTFDGVAVDTAPLDCDSYAHAGFDCPSTDRVIRVTAADGTAAHIASPVPPEDIDLDLGEAVSFTWLRDGLLLLDSQGEVVLDIGTGSVTEPFEVQHGDLTLRLAEEHDFSTSICVLGAPADCPGEMRLERLRVIGDETVELDTGITEVTAGDSVYRVGHFLSAVPFGGCRAAASVGYAVVRVR